MSSSMMVQARSPLVPAQYVPEACKAAGCRFKITHRGSAGSAFTFDHSNPSSDVVDRFPLSAAMLADVDIDIWGWHVEPWIKSLHAEAVAS